MVFVWACGRKGRALAGFCWAYVRKGRTLAGERDHPNSAPRPCGRTTVGFEKSMWTVTIDGARIFLGAHIDDFVIACANRQVLDGFRARLLDAFEGTYEGALQHYLGCEVTRDMEEGTTYLSQTHYAEEILRTYNFWNAIPRLTPIQPNTRLNKDDCESCP